MKRSKAEVGSTYLLLAIGALLMALPFYYMVVTSIKPTTEIAKPVVRLTVDQPTIKPYTDLIDGGLIVRATWNSFVVAALSTETTRVLIRAHLSAVGTDTSNFSAHGCSAGMMVG